MSAGEFLDALNCPRPASHPPTSQVLINKALTDLAGLKQVSGSTTESVVRDVPNNLLHAWGRALDLTFISDYPLETRTKEARRVEPETERPRAG